MTIDIDALVRLLGTYNLRLGKSRVQEALSNGDFVEWATVNLHSDNLLTVDELALYTALDGAGHVDTLVANKDLATVQSLDERDVRGAITELDRSTAAVTAHTETLLKQQAALIRLGEHARHATSQRAEFEERRRQAKESERKKAQAEVEEVAQMMEFRISDLEQQNKSLGATIHQTVNGSLQGDDRLLSSLQKLGWELDPDDPDEDEAVKDLRDICMKLIKTSVETVRTRLDRVYLEAIGSVRAGDDKGAASAEEINATQEEVESLYLEILPVAQMATERQHLEPALKSISHDKAHELGRSAAAVSYIQSCLDYLMERSAELTARVRKAQAHQSTCVALLTTAKKELAEPAVKVSPKRAREASLSIQTRSRANTAATPMPSHRRDSPTTTTTPEGSTPISALLRSLAISLPATHHSAGESTSTGSASFDANLAAQTLVRALAERCRKADDVTRATQQAFEKSIASHLADAGTSLQVLMDSVLAESPFGPGPAAGLVDPGIEVSLEVLSEEIAKVSDSVAAAERDMDAGVLAMSERRDAFVKRWATDE